MALQTQCSASIHRQTQQYKRLKQPVPAIHKANGGTLWCYVLPAKPWESCLNTPTDMLRTLSQEDMLGKRAASDKPHKQHTWTPSVSVA